MFKIKHNHLLIKTERDHYILRQMIKITDHMGAAITAYYDCDRMQMHTADGMRAQPVGRLALEREKNTKH